METIQYIADRVVSRRITYTMLFHVKHPKGVEKLWLNVVWANGGQFIYPSKKQKYNWNKLTTIQKDKLNQVVQNLELRKP